MTTGKTGVYTVIRTTSIFTNTENHSQNSRWNLCDVILVLGLIRISFQILPVRCKINGTLWPRSSMWWVFDAGQHYSANKPIDTVHFNKEAKWNNRIKSWAETCDKTLWNYCLFTIIDYYLTPLFDQIYFCVCFKTAYLLCMFGATQSIVLRPIYPP